MQAQYSMKIVSVCILINTYGYAEQVSMPDQYEVWRQGSQRAAARDDEQVLQTFEYLLKLLVAEQGVELSQGVQLCQQKFAKNSNRIPRELPSILPDIYAYIENLQQQIMDEKERASKTIDAILDMKSSLTDLRSTLIQTINILGNDQKVQVGEANTMAAVCQGVGLREILCALEDKLNMALANLENLTVIATEAWTLSQATLLNTNTIIYQNNHFASDIFAPFAAHVYGSSNNLTNVVGDPHEQVQTITSVDDINNATLSIIEWLKTVSAQLLELQNICGCTDCVDRYWMNT
jgi:hypothetical protein